jgi:hypothetical protein
MAEVEARGQTEDAVAFVPDDVVAPSGAAAGDRRNSERDVIRANSRGSSEPYVGCRDGG